MKNLIATVLVWLIASFPVFAQGNEAGYGYGHPHMSGYGYGGGWMFLGPVFMLFVLVMLVVGVFALMRWMGLAQGAVPNSTDSAIATLNQRLAKGEIDAEEYAERKALLLG
ncbi:SHOCT domain-containing protein [Pseudohalocynthiibacter aestuariivivens]|uniref:SHOCT domain-containing protein n=1 Tax=Pseudohalocynthiibacter aestuariivivens TaxID=1591409 RepID=A0ABV5JK74_9RHOB|nr:MULTISPECIES: SHOCT domain-containing protein [Pseudohalocynthiibacter]MBS9715573.1 SHOCT domain-containing protein [Pseudohalocynthiibacter aestuariivivens]MCK0102551.1 SHOCT domain-containing protein [Pseudohalocynthiibacter sp. F2068]